MRPIGFSTGAIAFGDFRGALATLRKHANLGCVELSALRVPEVLPLIEALPSLDLKMYSYVSFHAPSQFSQEDEAWLADLLHENVPSAWPIILHPDTIHDFSHWARFEQRVAIENMDRRKKCGRGIHELTHIFSKLPDARLCFDIGHSHQFDPSMTDAFQILTLLGSRIAQLHLSEVDSESHHEPVSYGTMLAFNRVSYLIPECVPVILESRVNESQIETEVAAADQSLPVGDGNAESLPRPA
jgi:hypothetical protein